MRAVSSADTQRKWIRILLLLHFGLLSGCATTQPVDYFKRSGHSAPALITHRGLFP